jgi:beta-lactamase superfamily II metal-dependent hydrolase
MSDPGDDNTDSLVVKIKHKESSAILTGDATGLTTTRILNNYYVHEDFLLTYVLLASHHVSFSHVSNNDAWVQATLPEFV